MTRLEFIDLIKNKVTLNCKLPDLLGADNIELIIESDAKPYFYRTYVDAKRKTYYYVDLQSMKRNLNTSTKIIQLPQEIEDLSWIYLVNYNDMKNLGYMFANHNLGLAFTSSPYVANLSITEWATSLAVMQSVGDALGHFSKNTVEHYFDPNTKMLELLTSVHYNLVLKAWARIPEEYLFEDPYFIKYVTGVAMKEYGRLLGFTDTTLAGNTKLNGENFRTDGETLITEVKEYITALNKVGYFINKTR